MKLTTKIFALLLAVTLLFTLSACGKKDSLEDKLNSLEEALSDPAVEDALDELENALEDMDDSLNDAADDMEDAAEDLEDAIEEVPVEAPAEETSGDFRRGTVSGSTYTNDYIGIGLDLPEGWTFFDDAQIAEVSGITQDMLNDSDVNSALESGKVIFDMYAMDANGNSINICIENLGAVYGTVLDEDGYFDLAEPNLTPSLESLGATDIVIERDETVFGGTTHPALFVSCDMGGVDFYEEIVAVKCGNYMALITAAGADPDAVLGIANSFYSI